MEKQKIEIKARTIVLSNGNEVSVGRLDGCNELVYIIFKNKAEEIDTRIALSNMAVGALHILLSELIFTDKPDRVGNEK